MGGAAALGMIQCTASEGKPVLPPNRAFTAYEKHGPFERVQLTSASPLTPMHHTPDKTDLEHSSSVSHRRRLAERPGGAAAQGMIL